MHIYTNSTGRSLPSVTEIINKTRPLSSVIKMNAAIEAKKKRENMSNKDWDKYMEAAQDRGTNTHHFMEVYFPNIEEANGYILKGKEVPANLLKKIKALREFWEEDSKIGKFVQALTLFSRELNAQTRDWNILSLESTLVHEELGYGGRCDTLLRIGDNHLLLDLKSNGGYWSSWKQVQCYGWQEWRKPKKEPLMITKQYANGNSREVKKKDANGKIVTKEEIMPPIEERGWDWVDDKLKDKYMQLLMYTMAARDMKKRGAFEHSIDNAALIVAFGNGTYQFIRFPIAAWEGCKSEMLTRLDDYKKNHYDKWKLEAAYYQSKG